MVTCFRIKLLWNSYVFKRYFTIYPLFLFLKCFSQNLISAHLIVSPNATLAGNYNTYWGSGFILLQEGRNQKHHWSNSQTLLYPICRYRMQDLKKIRSCNSTVRNRLFHWIFWVLSSDWYQSSGRLTLLCNSEKHTESSGRAPED